MRRRDWGIVLGCGYGSVRCRNHKEWNELYHNEPTKWLRRREAGGVGDSPEKEKRGKDTESFAVLELPQGMVRPCDSTSFASRSWGSILCFSLLWYEQRKLCRSVNQLFFSTETGQ